MDYITGANGFLGNNLRNTLQGEVHALPHELIQSSHLLPFDNFYYLSTYGNMSSHTKEDQIIRANVLDLAYILDQVPFDKGIHSFVFISSSSVKRRIQTAYSRTKKAAEELCLLYAEKYNAPVSIIRPLSITGVGDQDEHLIPTLIRSCKTGEEMPFVPDAYHDYIDVEDVVGGIIALSQQRARGIFELGTGKSRSNQEVREIVEKITGKKANVKIVSNMRSYDSHEWVSTNFRARQYGWQPIKTLEQTIKEMVND